jgi:chemotaxis regulatin CheY-phosphate phosphatase CheZ
MTETFKNTKVKPKELFKQAVQSSRSLRDSHSELRLGRRHGRFESTIADVESVLNSVAYKTDVLNDSALYQMSFLDQLITRAKKEPRQRFGIVDKLIEQEGILEE